LQPKEATIILRITKSGNHLYKNSEIIVGGNSFFTDSLGNVKLQLPIISLNNFTYCFGEKPTNATILIKYQAKHENTLYPSHYLEKKYNFLLNDEEVRIVPLTVPIL
jgi:hypothetical protein